MIRSLSHLKRTPYIPWFHQWEFFNPIRFRFAYLNFFWYLIFSLYFQYSCAWSLLCSSYFLPSLVCSSVFWSHHLLCYSISIWRLLWLLFYFLFWLIFPYLVPLVLFSLPFSGSLSFVLVDLLILLDMFLGLTYGQFVFWLFARLHNVLL